MSAGILFTAFEPSGDARAAPVIAALRSARPEVPIWAFGGPQMEQSGAQIIERTTEDAVMLAGAALQVPRHLRRLRTLRRWLADRRVEALVPVDSPAANWSVCRLIRRARPDARIVHLVAPQLWAWAPWRIRKLRVLTDHVLCLLPFEPDWFGRRGVSASFVGDPLFPPVIASAPAESDESGAAACTRVALLPGSRRHDVRANWPTMLEAFRRLRAAHRKLVGTVAALNDEIADRVRGSILPADGIEVRVGEVDAVLAWAQVALVKSGTGSLQTAAAGVPMVIVYNIDRWKWHLVGRWLVPIRTLTLPNLIAESQGLGRAVPELVPHFGQVAPVVAALEPLLTDPDRWRQQKAVMRRIAEPFAGVRYGQTAARRIIEIVSGTTAT